MTGPGFRQRRSFEKWLRSLPADTAIAERWSGAACPLCVFLNASGRAKKPFVSPRWKGLSPAIWRDDAIETGPLPLPSWASRFSQEIDALARVHFIGKGETFYRAVTPGDCLAVLAEIGGKR